MTLNSPLRLRNKICLLLLLISTQAQANTKDSIAKQLGLHLMVSLNPIIQLAEPIKNSGLFYSGAYYELQYGYKKHLAGLGYVRNYSAKNTYVNGVKKTNDRLHRRLNISYTYNFHQHKNWQFYVGAGFYFQQSDTMNILYTSIENQTERRMETETGGALLFRGAYKLNRFFSVVLELPIYRYQYSYKYDKEYPLTPSMNEHHSVPYSKTKFLIPSALYFRISI